LTSVRILAVIGNIVTILSLGLPLFTDIVCIQVLYNILHNNAIKNGR
jgi:amino acid transporter